MARHESKGYEDSYGGIGFDSCDEMLTALSSITDDLNWPVWVEASEPSTEDEWPGRLEIGYFSHRHGRTFIVHADAPTDDHLTAAREHVMHWTMGRADAQFRRYTNEYHHITA